MQRKVHDRFLSQLVDGMAMAKTRVGAGFEDGTQMGPLCHERRLNEMETLVEDARQKGATIALGGERTSNRGFFFAPTIVAGETEDIRLMKEEPFGPIAVVLPFEDFEDVISRANGLPFGLASYVNTGSHAHGEVAA